MHSSADNSGPSGHTLSPRAREVLLLLQACGPMSAEDIARSLGLSRRYVRELLNELQRAGRVRADRPGKRGRGHTTRYVPDLASEADTYNLDGPPKNGGRGHRHFHRHFILASEADSDPKMAEASRKMAVESDSQFDHERHFSCLQPRDSAWGSSFPQNGAGGVYIYNTRPRDPGVGIRGGDPQVSHDVGETLGIREGTSADAHGGSDRGRLVETAVRMIRAGWSVIPARGKVPIVNWHEYKQRLPTEAEWEEWAGKDFNALALVLGPATRPGGKCLWVLDIEAPYRAEAEKELAHYLSHTRVAESHGGGLHLYFVSDYPIRTQKCRWGDIIGEPHIVIVPPSEWDGRAYRWLNREKILKATPDEVLGRDPRASRPYTHVLRGETILEGTRNVTLASLAGWLWNHPEMTKPALRNILQAVNEWLCKPPLSPLEIERIAESISRYPKRAVRDEESVTPAEIVQIDESTHVEFQPVLQIGNIPIYPGETIVLSGMPGSGKSTWILTHMPDGSLLLETDFDAKVAAWLREKLGVHVRFEFAYVAADPARFIATLQSIENRKPHPVAIFVDTIQGVASDPDALDSIVQYVRDFATRTGIPIIVASHENRREASPLERIQGTLRLAQEATLVLRITGSHKGTRKIYVLKDRYAIVRDLPSSWEWNAFSVPLI